MLSTGRLNWFDRVGNPLDAIPTEAEYTDNGGYQPRWRADGHELYYLSEDRKLMAVSVTDSPPSPVGTPRVLFQTKAGGPNFLRTNYVPSRDGRRSLVNTFNGDPNTIPPLS
jgi:hypothetical protein